LILDLTEALRTKIPPAEACRKFIVSLRFAIVGCIRALLQVKVFAFDAKVTSNLLE